MSGLRHRYRAFGLDIASALEIPQLPRADAAPAGNDVDVGIRLGTVDDERIVTPDVRQAFIAAHFRYLVSKGREVTIDPLPGADRRDIADMIMSRIMPVIAYQRDRLVLHASAVAVDGHVIAFSGASGAGKSTMAAAMAARGHPIVSDDMLVVTGVAGQRQLALPGPDQLKLSREAIGHFGWRHDDLAMANTSEGKFLAGPRPSGSEARSEGMPLLALFLIGRGPLAMQPMRAIDVTAHWHVLVRSHDLIATTHRPRMIWRQWLELVGSVPVLTLDRTGDFSDLSAAAIRVEKFASSAARAANGDVRLK